MTTANALASGNAPTQDRTWTKTGGQLFDAERATREGHNYATGREAVEAGIDGLTWVEVPAEGELRLPFTPGEGIKAVIAQLDLRAVRRIAHDGAVTVRDDAESSTSLYSLYGIEVPEAGGLLRVFVVDRGTDLLPVAYDRVPTATVQRLHD